MFEDKTDGRVVRGEMRRAVILDAAVEVVAARGFGALTHRAAATAAGVSLASTTYHFPSISDLREAMFDRAGSRVGFAFRQVIEASGTALAEVPGICGRFSTELVTSRRADVRAVLEMIIAAGHDPNLRPLVRFFNDRLAELLAPYTGSRVRALTVAAAIQGLILDNLAQPDLEDAQALHDAVVDLVRRYHAAELPPETTAGGRAPLNPRRQPWKPF